MSASFPDLIYHATLEKQLLELFPQDLFEKLKLPSSTHLNIYQGLPRYSEPNYPKHLFVKQEFSDLSILKKYCVNKALLSTYSNLEFHLTHSLTLFTYVVPGGLGDYFAQQLLKKILREKFPFLKISTITLIHKTAPLQGIENSSEDHFIYFSSKEELQAHLFPKELLELLRNSSLIIQIPTFFPYWSHLITTLKTKPSFLPFPKTETIGEYGFINSKDFYPTTDAKCLGLHFLEYGLLLEKLPQKVSFENIKILPLLLNHTSLEDYKHSTHFYFAYLCTDYGHRLYLYTLLLYLSKDQKNIDLCSPDIGLFLKAIETSKQVPMDAGIKEIQIYYKNHYSAITIQETGKILRLIHTGYLEHKEFKLYLTLSEEPVGIRGNLSLSEVISLNKSYFYDLLEHNTILYYGLIAMARAHAPNALKLLELYEKDKDPLDVSYLGAELMQRTNALEELKQLNELIKEKHLANIHLENMVIRNLIHYEKSSLEKQESSLLKDFLNETISFQLLITELRKKISVY